MSGERGGGYLWLNLARQAFLLNDVTLQNAAPAEQAAAESLEE